MREHGTADDANKSRTWLALPPTDKQLLTLGITKQEAFGAGITRYTAGCRLTWKFNERGIKSRLMQARAETPFAA